MKVDKCTNIITAAQPWTVRLPDAPPEYKAEIKRLARKNHMSVGAYLSSLVDQAIDLDRARLTV